MEQKIRRIGNSLGIIIPKIILKQLHWKVGDEIIVEYYSVSKILTLTKKGQKRIPNAILTPDFLKAYEKVVKKLAPTMKELAKK